MKLATYILTSDLADAVEESVSKNFITFDKIKTYLVGHLPSVVNFIFSLIIALLCCWLESVSSNWCEK